eukprot:m.73716 g.73716  ORF g.73716 m.73716 type:complete len:284 (-) comp14376_c0_seq2:165-1016(-)
MATPGGDKQLQVGQWLLTGQSIAGYWTSIAVTGPFKICFDAGRVHKGMLKSEIVAVSHGHPDHIAALPQHAFVRNLEKKPRATYYVHRAVAAPLHRMLESAVELEGSTRAVSDLCCVRVPVKPVKLSNGFWLAAYAMSHRVPAQGYVLSRKSNRVRPEHRHLDKTQIHELIKLHGRDVVVDTATRVPCIAYTGDTRIDTVLTTPDMLTATILIMECTIIDDALSVEETRARGHIHLDELVEHADAFQNQHIVLTHFSARYSRHYIEEVVFASPFASGRSVHIF